MIYWKYSSINYIEESSFNKVLERFYDLKILGLVRENIQNSLDGKIPGCKKPVIVTIKTGKVSDSDIPGMDEIRERIKCLKGGNSYTRETIEHMKNNMNKKEVCYISFEDFNTKGLKGANNGQSTNNDDTWSSYAYNKGVHNIVQDNELENIRGGSHGIGKIASNAASDLNIMYFANCDEDGNKHLGGTIQLIEHEFNGQCYRATGYFTDIKEICGKKKFYPYENKFNKVFEKNTRGLKIVIPFLREQFNNESEIIKCICDSFFVAILEGKLEVIINEENINADTIKNYITRYYGEDIEKLKDEFTPLYFYTYLNKEPINLTIADKVNTYNFKLYFNYDATIQKGRVAIIRTIGMKIEDKKIKGYVNKPFNAVLLPNSIKEDMFLKTLENESHTSLAHEHIKNLEIQKNAKKFISNLACEIAKVIEEAIKINNPTDGFINTADILYEIENKFKKELVKNISTVNIKNEFGKETRKVIKTKGGVSNPKGKYVRPNGEGRTKRKGETKRDRGKISDGNDNEKKVQYDVSPGVVERIVVGNNEFVRFDFSESKEIRKVKVCNIALAVVDGTGEEYYDEFNMNTNYKRVIDMATMKVLSIDENKIKNVKIMKGIAQIKLELEKNFNRALKFVYYVEV